MEHNDLRQGLNDLIRKVETLEAENKMLIKRNEGLKKAVNNNYSPAYIKQFFNENPCIFDFSDIQIAFILDAHNKFLRDSLSSTPKSEVVKDWRKAKSDATYSEREKLFIEYFCLYLKSLQSDGN